jgi:hypothetical protein
VKFKASKSNLTEDFLFRHAAIVRVETANEECALARR